MGGRTSRVPLAPNEYLLLGTGERFTNEDGSSRQEALSRCRVGEIVRLECHHDNPADRNAVALLSVRGEQIGYLAREQARWVAAAMDAGRPAAALIERVGPKGRPFSPLAVTIRLRLSDGERSA